MIEIIVYAFSVIGAVIYLMIGLGVVFIRLRDDKDCQRESNLFNKYHKRS